MKNFYLRILFFLPVLFFVSCKKENNNTNTNTNKWTVYTVVNGLASDTINSITIDTKENKWIGTWNGLSKFDGVNWTTYTPYTINTPNNGVPSNYIWTVNIDIQGNKWIGAVGGVAEFDNINWTNFSLINNLAGGVIHSIAIDTLGCG